MPIPANYIPQTTKHASGQAVVRLNGRDHYLGRCGSKAAKLAYERLVAEWLAHGRSLPKTNGLTVNELVSQYWPWVQKHYRRPDGTPTNEVNDYKLSLRPLIHAYGKALAKNFGPLALQAVRELMVHGYSHPKYGPQPALARAVVNQRIGRIRRLFKWATANELVPSSVFHGLLAVGGPATQVVQVGHEQVSVAALCRHADQQSVGTPDQGASQVPFHVVPRRDHFGLLPLRHPTRADFRIQMDIDLIGITGALAYQLTR